MGEAGVGRRGSMRGFHRLWDMDLRNALGAEGTGSAGRLGSVGYGPAGCSAMAMLRKSSACGQAAAKARRTREAVSFPQPSQGRCIDRDNVGHLVHLGYEVTLAHPPAFRHTENRNLSAFEFRRARRIGACAASGALLCDVEAGQTPGIGAKPAREVRAGLTSFSLFGSCIVCGSATILN